MFEKLTHLITGQDAETAATAFLKEHGLKIISRNKRYKVGELDIIAEDNHSLVFVEVKYRKNTSHGTPAEMVDARKQAKLQKAALIWMQENNPKMQKACRFDVIAISNKSKAGHGGSDEKYPYIEWIKNAF